MPLEEFSRSAPRRACRTHASTGPTASWAGAVRRLRCKLENFYAENLGADTYHPRPAPFLRDDVQAETACRPEGGIEMDEAGLHHLVFARRHTDNQQRRVMIPRRLRGQRGRLCARRPHG